MKLTRITASSLAACLGFATLSLSVDAQACGGLFCSNSPVNQSAERIIFADHGDGTMTATIEIKYEGPAERFSWVIPVPGVPEFGLSSEQALDRLQQRDNPIYRMLSDFDDSCFGGAQDAGAAPSGFADAGALSEPDDDVTVVAADSLGPFDYDVIKVDSNAKEPAAIAIDWLSKNNYDVTALGEEILGDYLKSNMNLVAFRLSKTASTGSIRPVTLKYKSKNPMIPIRPTAVAANEDMGILVWVLGEHRAVPTNYRTLELNQSLIDWFNPGPGYNDVVIAAANEAGGQGFVTEIAREADDYEKVIWNSNSERAWRQIQRLSDPEDRLQLLLRSAGNFGSLDGYVDAVREAIPLREGVSPEGFVRCIRCYFEPYETEGSMPDGGAVMEAGVGSSGGTVFPKAGQDAIAELDGSEFLKSLEALVIRPMAETQALFTDSDYVTRLYTTMSPDEMTKDPIFGFNPDLKDVDNLHQAERSVSCAGGGETKWVVEIDGTEIRGRGQEWPIKPGSVPANKRILQHSTSGAGKVIADNSDEIEDGIKPQIDPKAPDGNGNQKDPMTLGGTQGTAGPNGDPNGSNGDPNGLNGDSNGLSGDSRQPSAKVNVSGSGCSLTLPGAPEGSFAGLGLLLGLNLIARRRRRALR